MSKRTFQESAAYLIPVFEQHALDVRLLVWPQGHVLAQKVHEPLHQMVILRRHLQTLPNYKTSFSPADNSTGYACNSPPSAALFLCHLSLVKAMLALTWSMLFLDFWTFRAARTLLQISPAFVPSGMVCKTALKVPVSSEFHWRASASSIMRITYSKDTAKTTL
jgi:hypothetical protein